MSKSKTNFSLFQGWWSQVLNECVAKADEGSRREGKTGRKRPEYKFREVFFFNRTELGISHSIHSPFILNFLRKSNEFSTESHYLPKII